MMNHKPKGETFWGAVLFLAVIGALIAIIVLSVSGCKKKDTTYQDSAIVTANKAYIDSLEHELRQRDSVIVTLKEQAKTSVIKQTEIVTKFKPVYEKINNDTGYINQFNYLQVLLSESKRYPLKRD